MDNLKVNLNLSALKSKVASSMATQKENNKKEQIEKDKRKQQSDNDKKIKQDRLKDSRKSYNNNDRPARGGSDGRGNFNKSNDRRDNKPNDRRDFKSNDRRDFKSNDRRDNNSDRKDFKSNDRRDNNSDRRDFKSNDRRDFKSNDKREYKGNDFRNDRNSNNKFTPTGSNTTELKPKESKKDILRREALELGATEDDIELLKDLAEDDDELSEQEFDSNDNVDGDLTKDLKEFIKGIGLSGSTVDDVIEDEEEAEEEEEEAEVEESEEAEAEAEEEEAEAEEEAEEEEAEEEVEEEDKTIDPPAKNSTDKSTDKVTNLQTVISDKLIVPARNDWYAIPLGKKSLPNTTTKLNPVEIEKLYKDAQKIVESENTTYYEEFNKSSSQKRFLSQILANGTLNDKISALTLLIQEAPLHNLKALDNLFGMCEKKSRTAALQCLDALVDLFVNGILPPDRKLKYFNKQPDLSFNLSNLQLSIYYFEDYLKKLYFKFISILEKLSHDSIVHVRTKIVGYLFQLLKSKPEQEANLLRLGVNKLGDIDNKVSSKASYNILLLEQEHPAMKQIIIDSVIDIMFRKNNDQHAIYYSCLALNQTIITKKEEILANKLCDAYFALFEKLLIETDSFNITKLKDSKDYQIDGRRKRNFKKGKKGGKSVKLEIDQDELNEEKNSKLFTAILTGLNRAYPFSNLPNEVFENHLNTLFKITHSTNFNTSIQSLLLIHNIVTSTKHEISTSIKDRYYRTLYESLLDDRLLTSSKQAIYLNLLFKSLKEDDCKDRVMSFVKRICQICLSWINIGTVSGMLYLLIELEKTTPELRNLFYNTPMDDVLRDNEEDEEEEESSTTKPNEKVVYDPRKRDPKFTNASKSSLWELNSFLQHYHPTIQTYAQSFLDLEKSNDIIKPDLGLFTLSHFLDRFVYKTAKKKPTSRGVSIMQPLGGSQTGSLLVKTTTSSSSSSNNESIIQLPVNTEDWINLKTSEIKPEDKFFHQYFSTKQEKSIASKMDKDINDKALNDDFDNEEELNDDDVWDALVKSNVGVEGDEDDLDDDLDDFEMDMSDDEDDDEDDEEELVVNDDEDEDDEDEDEEGLVRLTTVEDLVGDSDIEEDEVADADADEDDESSGDEDIKGLLNDEDDDEFDSDEFELQALGEDDDDDELSEDEEIYESEKEDKKRSADDDDDDEFDKKSNKKAKKVRLPTFASADDYSKYLESSDDEDY